MVIKEVQEHFLGEYGTKNNNKVNTKNVFNMNSHLCITLSHVIDGHILGSEPWLIGTQVKMKRIMNHRLIKTRGERDRKMCLEFDPTNYDILDVLIDTGVRIKPLILESCLLESVCVIMACVTK